MAHPHDPTAGANITIGGDKPGPTPGPGGQIRPEGGIGGFLPFGGLFDILTTPTGPGSGIQGPIGTAFNRARQERASAFGERFPAFLQQLMQTLGFGEGGQFGGPNRADLLDPRLADIEGQRKSQAERIRQTATSQGRNVSGSVFQDALQQLQTGATREGQRATGDVDTLLAQLGLGRQGLMQQLLMSILGQFGGFK